MTKHGTAAFTFATTETSTMNVDLHFNSANAKIIQTPKKSESLNIKHEKIVDKKRDSLYSIQMIW